MTDIFKHSDLPSAPRRRPPPVTQFQPSSSWLIHFNFSLSPVSSVAHFHFLLSTSLGCSIITSHDPCLKTQPHHLPSSPTWLFWETTLSAQINVLLTDWCIDCLELCLLHKICHPDVLALSIYLLASFLKSISLVSGSLHSDSRRTWKLKFLLLTFLPSWLPELCYQRLQKNIFKRFIILCVCMFYLHVCIVSHVYQVPQRWEENTGSSETGNKDGCK